MQMRRLTRLLFQEGENLWAAIRGAEFVTVPGSKLGDSLALCDHIREIAIQRIDGRVGTATTFAMGQIENAIMFLLNGT